MIMTFMIVAYVSLNWSIIRVTAFRLFGANADFLRNGP